MARNLRHVEKGDFFELDNDRIGVVILPPSQSDTIFFKLSCDDKVRKKSCIYFGRTVKRIVKKDSKEWQDIAKLFFTNQ